MKINSINNISFQKKLVAKCKYIQDNQQKDANIYELEGGVDDKYLSFNLNKIRWAENAFFRGSVIVDYLDFKFSKSTKFYVMEDEKENLIAYSEFSNRYNTGELDIIETVPDGSIYNPERKTKYIGETMIAFLVNLCKKLDKDFKVVDIAENKQTKDFYYKNCKLRQVAPKEAVLLKEDFNNFLEQNEHHTGSKIDLISQ